MTKVLISTEILAAILAARDKLDAALTHHLGDEVPGEITSARQELDAPLHAVQQAMAKPEILPIAARKLEQLREAGYRICGYAIERDGQLGFITDHGFVGWWKEAEHQGPASLDEAEDILVTHSRTDRVNDMALTLFEAWVKADPLSMPARHPTAYLANFADMARAVPARQTVGTGSPSPWHDPDWVLMPAEPNPEMVAAWHRYKNGHHFHDEPPPRDTSDYGAYRAMLAARPAAVLPTSVADLVEKLEMAAKNLEDQHYLANASFCRQASRALLELGRRVDQFTADPGLPDYWADAIGGEYSPAVLTGLRHLHPLAVKEHFEAVRGTAAADIIAGLIFANQIARNRAHWFIQLYQELRRQTG